MTFHAYAQPAGSKYREPARRNRDTPAWVASEW